MTEKNEKTPILPTYFKADMGEDSQKLLPSLEEKKRARCIVIISFVLILVAAILIMIIVLAVVYSRKSTSLADSINSGQLLQSLQELQDTSINNSRSVLNGYNDSAEYIFKQLEGNGYEPVRQYFNVPVFDNLSPDEAVFKVEGANINISYIESSQFNVMTYSGACESCDGQLIDKTSDDNYGCDNGWNATDQVVLMAFNSSKGCSLYEKASNALVAGAKAVIFQRDEGDTAEPPASRVYEKTDSGEIITVAIPSIGVTSGVGQQLKAFLSSGTVTASISTFTSVTIATTYNVLARTSSGSNESVIVVGSHLDSVPVGPGINDNGSGSIANLRLAIELGKLGITPKSQVLFAWWGAEELGLLGSTYFVAQLSKHEQSGIALNLNFDMIASPNFQRGIYNGSSAEEAINSASTTIQDILIQYFEQSQLTYEIVPFTGRSDYGPFIEVDIPAGGLFTGAEDLKTQEQFELFGGLVNARLDPCYHQACDTMNNVNSDVYQQMTKAAAYALETFVAKDDLKDFLENGVNS